MKNLQNLTAIVFFIVAFTSCSSSKSGGGLCNTECEYTIATGELAGTVDSSISDVLNLTFTNARSGSPISDGTKATFTIDNNELTVEIEGKECITLKNPISPGAGSTEVIYKDTCRDNLLYAVSVSVSGGLNEINLFDINKTFFGQFKQ